MLLRSSRRRRRLAMLLCVPLLTLPSCAKPTLSSDQTNAILTTVPCKGLARITWSQHDTDQTIREIKANNAAYDAICGGSK